jgi:COMPASS component SWD3
MLFKMRSNGVSLPGPVNRVFSLKFHEDDPNIMLSGGWDNSVYIYDVRTESPCGSIYGPCLSGDSLDMQGDQVLTGSHRGKEPLQVWDLKSR